MESVELQIDLREAGRKGPSRRIRRAGKLPAVLYGPKRTSLPVTVDAKEFNTKVASVRGSVLVRLHSDNAELGDHLALVKDLQRHPLTGDVVHADFYEVDMSAKLRVRVPLELVGKAAGVEFGGILQHVQREVEVRCLPSDIPALIEVDVSHLGINDSLHISEVKTPPGVEIQYEANEPVAMVLASHCRGGEGRSGRRRGGRGRRRGEEGSSKGRRRSSACRVKDRREGMRRDRRSCESSWALETRDAVTRGPDIMPGSWPRNSWLPGGAFSSRERQELSVLDAA